MPTLDERRMIDRYITREQFDRAFPEEGDFDMNFSDALMMIKAGKRLARSGWNGKGMFIVMVPELQLPPYNTQGTERKVNDRTAKWIGEDQPLNCRPYIAMFTAQKEWQPGWLASQTDMFAEDWGIVPDATT